MFESLCVSSSKATDKVDALYEARMVNEKRIYTNRWEIYKFMKFLIFCIKTPLSKLENIAMKGDMKQTPYQLRKQWRDILKMTYHNLYKKNNHPNPIVLFEALDLETNLSVLRGVFDHLAGLFTDYVFHSRAYLIFIDEENKLQRSVNLLTQEGKMSSILRLLLNF